MSSPEFPTVNTLQTLPADAFALHVQPLLSDLATRLYGPNDGNVSDELQSKVAIIATRATEPQTVAAVRAVLTPPWTDQRAYVARTAFDYILLDLPLAALELYRAGISLIAHPAAETGSKSRSPSASNTGTSSSTYVYRYDVRTGLTSVAPELLYFMDNPTATWTPRDKGDDLAIRSIAERVNTAAEMKPHVPELLEWLADMNWPPYGPCRQQLARFPEITVGPIAETIDRERGDGGFIFNLLDFVNDCVPVRMWEGMKMQLRALVDGPKKGEEDEEATDSAREMLEKLEEWEKTPVGS